MAQLLVRNLNEGIVTKLKQRAVRNHRSMEAEHRMILRDSLETQKSFKQMLLDIPAVGDDRDFERASGSLRDVAL